VLWYKGRFKPTCLGVTGCHSLEEGEPSQSCLAPDWIEAVSCSALSITLHILGVVVGLTRGKHSLAGLEN